MVFLVMELAQKADQFRNKLRHYALLMRLSIIQLSAFWYFYYPHYCILFTQYLRKYLQEYPCLKQKLDLQKRCSWKGQGQCNNKHTYYQSLQATYKDQWLQDFFQEDV